LVHLALDFSEGASILLGEDHQQRFGRDVRNPPCRLELNEIL
jgi:hypothetical protein